MKKISGSQKSLMILFGILVSLVLIEVLLRGVGLVLFFEQRYFGLLKEPLLQHKKPVYTILAIGESTTAGSINSWPYQLEIILNNRSKNMRFKVYNEGIPGINTAFILAKIETNLQKYQPDLVISMMGINDKEGFNLMYVSNQDLFTKVGIKNLRTYKLYKWIISSWVNKLYLKENNKKTYYETNLSNFFTNGDGFSEVEEYFSTAVNTNKTAAIFLYNELGRLYHSHGELNHSITLFEKVKSINPKEELTYSQIGWIYTEIGDIEKAEREFRALLEINPNSYEGNIGMGYIYHKKEAEKMAIASFEKAMEINPNGYEAYLALMDYYYLNNNSKAEKMVLKILELVSSEPEKNNNERYKVEAMNKLWYIYLAQGKSSEEIEKLFRQKGYSLKQRDDLFFKNITKYHYNKLYEILKSKGIKYVAMQYPMKEVGELKGYFNGEEDILFVSNKETFGRELMFHNYNELFTDKFGGIFGHTTPKGTRLIAENLAGAILANLTYFNKP